MTIRIQSGSRNLQNFMRDIGYRPLGFTPEGELNAVRPLMGTPYPRFHIYSKEEGRDIVINIHLDQKKPSYEGSTAHSGDYDSDIVHDEVRRIRSALGQ